MPEVSGVDSTSFQIVGYLFLDVFNPSALYIQTDQLMSVKHNTCVLISVKHNTYVLKHQMQLGLRHCVTSPEVAGSIPDVATGIFH